MQINDNDDDDDDIHMYVRWQPSNSQIFYIIMSAYGVTGICLRFTYNSVRNENKLSTRSH